MAHPVFKTGGARQTALEGSTPSPFRLSDPYAMLSEPWPVDVVEAGEASGRPGSRPLDALNVAPRLRLMTPHKPPLKREVGVRELHDQLSRYVQHAAAGGEVVVTMRGRRVARLAPVSGDDALADLRARGLVQEPEREWSPQPSGRASPIAPVSDLVAEQRR